LPSRQIAAETGLERKRVLRALAVVREALLRSTQACERAPLRAPRQITTRLPPRAAALGLYATAGRLGVRMLPDKVAERIRGALRAGHGADLSALPSLHGYTAVVSRNRLYRLRPPEPGSGSFGQIEAFWSYLQRQLRARGGIRGERLPLHLAEFAWRYNRRRVAPGEQVRELLALLRESRWSQQD
jgi:hypothetical protein